MTFGRVALRRVAQIMNGGTPGPEDGNWGGNVAWATPIDLGQRDGQLITSTMRSLTEQGARTGSTIAPTNSVLLSTRAPIGYVARAAGPMAFNQGCKAIVPTGAVFPQFLLYAIVDATEQLQALGQGSTFLELSGSALGAIKIPVPSVSEQRQIADYLDAQTAKIDALIGKQEQLIETLAERRQAVISHAVTKGLDPNAPMKESGIYWLGQIPHSWSLRKFSQVVRINGGQVDPRVEPYRSMTLIAPNHVEQGTARLLARETAEAQGADSGKYLVRQGQVIYSKIRPALSKAVIAPEDCLCSADMYGIDADRRLISNRFLVLLMLSRPFTKFVVDVSMRVAMPKVNRETLSAGAVWFPALTEQAAILEYIDRETAQIDALVVKAREMIDVLKERRQALISAAVTGKIDVRTASGVRP